MALRKWNGGTGAAHVQTSVVARMCVSLLCVVLVVVAHAGDGDRPWCRWLVRGVGFSPPCGEQETEEVVGVAGLVHSAAVALRCSCRFR